MRTCQLCTSPDCDGCPVNEDPERYRSLERRDRWALIRVWLRAFGTLLFAVLVIATCYQLIEGQSTGHAILNSTNTAATNAEKAATAAAAAAAAASANTKATHTEVSELAKAVSKYDAVLGIAYADSQTFNNDFAALCLKFGCTLPAPVQPAPVPTPVTSPPATRAAPRVAGPSSSTSATSTVPTTTAPPGHGHGKAKGHR